MRLATKRPAAVGDRDTSARLYNPDLAENEPCPGAALLNEALRSGLQSPSVRYPSIRQKLQILHLIDVLGLYSVDVVLPGLITLLARTSASGMSAPGETLAAINNPPW
jgi:hypothetical protein